MRDDVSWDWLINIGIVFGTIVLVLVSILIIFKYFIPSESRAILKSDRPTAEVIQSKAEDRIFLRPALLNATTYPYPQEGESYYQKLSLVRGFAQGVSKNYPCRCYFQVIGKDNDNKEVFMQKFPAQPVDSGNFVNGFGQMISPFPDSDTRITQDCLLEPCLDEEFYGRNLRYFYRLLLEGPDSYEVKGNWEYLGVVKSKKK